LTNKWMIEREGAAACGSRSATLLGKTLFIAALCLTFTACSAINPGKWKGIEKTSADEHYYLLKNLWLTAGSAALPREHFDHTMQETVNLIFVPANEKNYYVSKTVWTDPNGVEFRTIRQTHDKKSEEDKGEDSKKGGKQRVHSMPLQELYKHKPGMWKVELYLDDQLARRLKFSVR
jgi:hypothetical protein